ncbi:unnamed protein product [Brassicogethes aeneus]|uniref:Ubiquitin carboxyl-terminal hydrolase n=1 Tax=Brassicogethes aeneus TaxID=1431903 RepID=A0A9P0AZF0_BRAAE|nr:unnamed protein product [Brassicogethes aeneus]
MICIIERFNVFLSNVLNYCFYVLNDELVAKYVCKTLYSLYLTKNKKMVQRSSCVHFGASTDIPITKYLNSLEKTQCADCDYKGPNLWICLHKNCLKIGCSEQTNDHSTKHNTNQPSHSIHMNLSTNRIWCYNCQSEVFAETAFNSGMESDAEAETTATTKSKDSGHGSYSTLRTDTPDRNSVFVFERSVGLSVGMNGDGSESSDEDDAAYASVERPYGLVGLQNIGNTCYMNAALQALSNTEPLTKFFLDCNAAVHVLSEGRKPGLSRTYQALMKDVWVKKNGGYVVPSGILYGIRNVHPMFRGYQQHDTQEFLRNFMDQLHEELKQVAAPEPAVGNDGDTFSLAMDEPALSYDSSEGEYETCDSGVSERSSLSDDTERPAASAKRRLSRCGSPNRRQRPRVQSCSVIDSQPSAASSQTCVPTQKKQAKHRSIISDIFDGKLLSSVQCLTCNRVSSRVETFQDLSLPIPSRDHLAVLHGRSAPGAACADALAPVQDGWLAWMLTWLKSWFYGPTVTLHDCLAAFFSTDELKGDNMYSCEKCNKLRNGVKFSKVLQLPEVLCIHLKRFRHELMFSSKISSAVSFPLKGLDMRPYLHTDCTSNVSNYELFSVICHYGTAGGGHYICFAYNSGYWYEFDDQYVTRVTPEKILTCEAYVLFYRKATSSMEPIKAEAMSIAEEISEETQRPVYISKQWLNRFYYCAEPGPIDNSDFLCRHGAVDPERGLQIDHLAVQVPVEVYEYLHSKFGGCPTLPDVRLCPACEALGRKIVYETETMLKLSREMRSCDVPQTHYLSTTWYNQWHTFVQRKTLEPPGPIDNARIEQNQDLNEAAEVTEDIWSFFHGIYGGGPEIRIHANCDCESEWRRYQSNRRSDKPDDSDDRRLHSHGEPMETEGASAAATEEGEGEDEEGGRAPAAIEKSVENGHAIGVGSDPNVDDDDIDEEEANEMRSSAKHRRRRINLTGL